MVHTGGCRESPFIVVQAVCAAVCAELGRGESSGPDRSSSIIGRASRAPAGAQRCPRGRRQVCQACPPSFGRFILSGESVSIRLVRPSGAPRPREPAATLGKSSPSRGCRAVRAPWAGALCRCASPIDVVPGCHRYQSLVSARTRPCRGSLTDPFPGACGALANSLAAHHGALFTLSYLLRPRGGLSSPRGDARASLWVRGSRDARRAAPFPQNGPEVQAVAGGSVVDPQR